MVNWRARVMTQDRKISEGHIYELLQSGVSILYSRALPINSPVNIEFYVNYKNEQVRIRAKTRVNYCMVRSNNDGAEIELKFTEIAQQERHTLNNVLQIFVNAKEFSLKK